MAFIQCGFRSASLEMSANLTIVLPEINYKNNKDFKFQTLLLLHGLSDDHTAWSRYTSIERYANGNALAVIMPAGDRSCYTNMAYGGAYFDYISKEVHEFTRAYFPLSEKREDNFIAGLSMGGYGAFKIALTNPENYAAAASFSGALDMKTTIPRRAGVNTEAVKKVKPYLTSLFGNADTVPDKEDCFFLLDKCIESGVRLPKLIQYCGTMDFWHTDNLNFRNHLLKIAPNSDYIYEDWEGDHNWEFWDISIQKALRACLKSLQYAKSLV